MLLSEIKSIYHKELGKIYPKEEIDHLFYRSIEHHLGLERFVLVIQPQFTLTKGEEEPLFRTLSSLKQEIPLQYVLGKTHFMDLEFQVNEHVLIPRPETEELVHWVLDDISSQTSDIGHQTSDIKVLDIGTGSGCIPVALAKNLPNLEVHALDISSQALKVAKENAAKNKAEVTFHQHNILDFSLKLELEFDIIVSNPPYVREMEKSKIENNVKKFEPEMALFVPDEKPLIFYEAIAQFASKYLKDNGLLYLEINQYLGQETQALLEAHNFLEIELRKDIFGNDRMLKAKKR
ncbi:peptide chain release factor N(5)-glutamine methyltransferase [Flagellimonas sp.]|uniref:peptide chain release factor N(5)-glutamine methyltransferase n=1 Tax=Flagellimonas sp. TaxID=2058762 RepID=UPI003F4A7A49